MKGAEVMREFEPDWIVAMGGGSPIDAAKAMWAFYEYPDTKFEDLITPFAFPTLRQKAKFLAIPSTSGTATEVTAFSVITDYQKGIKYPLADFNITPDIAIVDPDLAETMPAKLTAHTGMDALTHAIEAYVSTLNSPFTDPLALKAIEMVFTYLPDSYNGDMKAREQMHYAQCLAGMAFSNALLGIVHSMAHKTGAAFSTGHIPHGCANAIYLPYVIQYNAKDATAMKRYADIARAVGLTGATDAELVDALIAKIDAYNVKLNIPKTLKEFGVDEKEFNQVGPAYKPITSEYLDYDEVMESYDRMLDWLAGLYVNILNLIQYMHDKYYYEAAEMALIDTDVRRTFATGIAGFSHVIDSLSAIKYAKVKTVRNEDGIVVGFETEGDFPRYGNDDERADEIGVWLLGTFLDKIKKYHTYRDSEPTTSILTITSNVVYGKATGMMPDGRKAFTPFAPGASPSYGAEQNGLLASLNSVAKLPYHWALDGISNTQTINPDALGHNEDERKNNLVQVLDGYFDQGAHNLNVNVFGKEKLLDAQKHPEKEEYANFTIRVSGYAVKFIDLTEEQQNDVIARTCHGRM